MNQAEVPRLEVGALPVYAQALVRGGCVPEGAPPALAVLAALEGCRTEFEAVSQALARPQARLPFRYELGVNFRGLPFSVVHSVGYLLGLRSLARGTLGDRAGGMDDVLLQLRLARILQGEASLSPLMAGVAMESAALAAVEVGLRERWWRAEQLEALRSLLRRPPLLPMYRQVMEFEVAVLVKSELSLSRGDDPIWGWSPSLMADHRKLSALLRFGTRQYTMNSLLRVPEGFGFFRSLCQPDDFSKQGLTAWQSGDLPSTFSSLMKRADRQISRILMLEAHARIAVIALSAEQWRRTHGRYPTELPEDVPEAWTYDPMSPNVPLTYRCTEDGSGLTIYSEGWDEEDNEGKPCPRGEVEPGDWVWRLGTGDAEK